MKKFLWISFGLFVAVLVALISAPLFINVDQYRPQILEEANKRMNGKLTMGKLNLSLWGAIKIHAESIDLKVNGYAESLVKADTFHLEIPYSSLLAGAPEVVAVLQKPTIFLERELSGRINAMDLLKSQSPSAMVEDSVSVVSAASEKKSEKASQEPVVTSPAPQTASSPAPETKVPALLAGASLGLRIQEGNVVFQDKSTKSDYRSEGLELTVKNLGLGSSMKFQLAAPLKGAAPSLKFDGPVKMEGELTPHLVGSVVKSAKGSLDVDASGLQLKSGPFFKKATVPFLLKVAFDGDDKQTVFRQVDVRLQDFNLHAKGMLEANPVTAKFEINSDPLRLENLQDLVSLLSPYQLKGQGKFNALVEIHGNTPKINGDIKVSDGSISYPEYLHSPLQYQLQAGFSEMQLNLTRLSLAGPDSDLQVVGSVKNFLAPQFSISFTGKSFNLDKMIKFPEKKTVLLPLVPSAYAAAPDLNPMAELAKNPILAAASGSVAAQLGKIVAYGAVLEKAALKGELKNMNFTLNDSSFVTFKGKVKTKGEFNLKSPGLAYSSQGTVEGLSGKDAFAAYFPKYANTLEGDMNASWNVKGSAYPAALRLRNLNGSAKILAQNGSLKSVDFQESINSSMKKVPFLKDKNPIKIDDGFKTLSADLTFSGGVTKIQPMEMQPRNRGVVVKGRSVIQENLEQESFFDIFDPQGVLPKELQKAGKPALAFHLQGPLSSPRTDYEYTVKALISTAGANVVKNAAGKALDKFLNKEGSEDALKKAAEKLRQKFKF